ncbi:MAG: rhodanese-related sulfurtransferase [Fimbriimonas sp.]
MSAPPPWYVTSFYRFFPLAEEGIEPMRAAIEGRMLDQGILGLVLLATEGINGTVAGPSGAVEAFKGLLAELTGLDLSFKDSVSERPPFHRVSVDRRREIVGMKRPDLVPAGGDDRHLSPREWHEWLASGRPALVIDTRNDYEAQLGTFAGAVNPHLKTFSDWGAYLDRTKIPEDTPVLIYCTGGIRCEKAILEMRTRGIDQVYQLRDGILGYLAEYPDGFFEGDCFVFDDRVALDKDLRPTTRFGICPGCGLPASDRRECTLCEEGYFRCESCGGNWPDVCSKTCRDRLEKPRRRTVK